MDKSIIFSYIDEIEQALFDKNVNLVNRLFSNLMDYLFDNEESPKPTIKNVNLYFELLDDYSLTKEESKNRILADKSGFSPILVSRYITKFILDEQSVDNLFSDIQVVNNMKKIFDKFVIHEQDVIDKEF